MVETDWGWLYEHVDVSGLGDSDIDTDLLPGIVLLIANFARKAVNIETMSQ